MGDVRRSERLRSTNRLPGELYAVPAARFCACVAGHH